MGDEFYAIIKLTSGEEILSLVCVDETEDEPIIILNSPVTMKWITHGGMKSLIKVKPWLDLSDQDIFVIHYDKIITMTETHDKKLISVYDQYINDADLDFFPPENGQVGLSTEMGYLSTVDDARKYLEGIYNNNIKES
tara:strand:+ start:846 stop:1259 length:414 start_codon:yes stop_codon:yes gene_type:complete